MQIQTCINHHFDSGQSLEKEMTLKHNTTFSNNNNNLIFAEWSIVINYVFLFLLLVNLPTLVSKK